MNTLRNIESPLADAPIGAPKLLCVPAYSNVCVT